MGQLHHGQHLFWCWEFEIKFVERLDKGHPVSAGRLFDE
jgi:hypothetical protein